MSVAHERSALARPVSLFDHARRLHRLCPDDPLPDGGFPLPDNRDDTGDHDGKDVVLAVLHRFLEDSGRSPQDLHDECTRLTVRPWTLLDLKLPRSPQLLNAARWLIAHGTDRHAVHIGLGLLNGNAEPRDVPVVRTLGLLCAFEGTAAHILAALPLAAHDLIWLADRSRRRTRSIAVEALLGHPDPAVRSWVRSTPRDALSNELARKIAVHQGLLGLLDEADDLLWDQTGNLLLAMTCPHNYRCEIGDYPDALAVYQRWAELADQRPVSVDRAAMLAAVAEDLTTGPAALVAGSARDALIDRIGNVLAAWTGLLEPRDPVEARRASWIATQKAGVPEGRFAVRVVVHDPRPVGFPMVEARVLIDGVPIIAAAFDEGPAEDADRVLGRGLLRATDEPHEVKLAEAYCTEGCCGALRVTIVREGQEVVWKDWRTSMKGDPPGEFRFDASEYDREIARAEQDHSWEWPARTAARLLRDELRADPSVLGRWDCELGWSTSWLKDYDTARLTFGHPAVRPSLDDPWVQFGLLIEVGDRAPEVVAAEAAESLRRTDPKSVAEVIGGSREGAAKLGFVLAPPIHW